MRSYNMENSTAWINSCKLSGDGYQVNGSMSVPNDPANRHYVMVQEWIAEGNTPSPQFTQDELDATAAQELNVANKAYLNATDHKFINGYKTKPSDSLPDIELLRDAAREAVRTYEGSL